MRFRYIDYPAEHPLKAGVLVSSAGIANQSCLRDVVNIERELYGAYV